MPDPGQTDGGEWNIVARGRQVPLLEVPQSRDGRSERAQAEFGEPIFYRGAREAIKNQTAPPSRSPDRKTEIVKLLVVSRRPLLLGWSDAPLTAGAQGSRRIRGRVPYRTKSLGRAVAWRGF